MSTTTLLIVSSVYRVITLLVGAFFAWLGYRLFVRGLFTNAGDIEAVFGDVKLLMKRAAPGTVFVAAGATIVVVSLWKGSNVRTWSGLESSPTASQVEAAPASHPDAAAQGRSKLTSRATSAVDSARAGTESTTVFAAQPGQETSARISYGEYEKLVRGGMPVESIVVRMVNKARAVKVMTGVVVQQGTPKDCACFVIFGLFRRKTIALALADSISKRTGETVRVVPDTVAGVAVFSVQSGPFARREEAVGFGERSRGRVFAVIPSTY